MVAWIKLKARWSEPTQVMVMHEFLEANRLFGALVEFARRKK